MVVSDDLTLPVAVTVESIAPSQGTFTGGTWAVGTLAQGSRATLTVVLTVGVSAPTGTNVISNTATVLAANEALINTGDDSATASTSVLSTASCLLTGDPSSGAPRVLGCAGTPAPDQIEIALKGNLLEVTFVKPRPSSKATFAVGDVGRIIVFGLAGNDFIHVASNITTAAAWLFGGPGNDHLHVEGGSLDNVLVGEDGDDHLEAGTDKLKGGEGRDILIGGRGHDRLKASAGDNLLIAGFTDFDRDMSALEAIRSEWTRTGQDPDHLKDYQTRVDHLLTGGGRNGTIRLNPTTVHDDGNFDVLDGAPKTIWLDWFFANLDGDGDRKKKDDVRGLRGGRIVTDIDQ